MSKEKIEVGDWIRLTGKTWAEDHPDAPSHVQVSMIHLNGRIDAEEVGDVGNSFGLYGPDNEVIGCDYACEWVPASEVPFDILAKNHPSIRVLNPESVVELTMHEGVNWRDPINPDYYKFPSGVEVKDISRYLTSCGGQALQYIARSTRLDGNNKGDAVENLRKAVEVIGWEIERLEAN